MSIEAMKLALEKLRAAQICHPGAVATLVGEADALVSRVIEQAEKQEIEPDKDCVENDGCPTEKAVLQRFWREHQKAEKQEPYGYLWFTHHMEHRFTHYKPKEEQRIGDITPIYTAPPQRKQQQAMRLYKSVERLALQADEDTDESIEWLCGEHGGMFKLYEKYFSPQQRERVQFPTMLRKMWSGGEVQAWLDENVNKEDV